ncbi:MAG: glycosyltransferase family 39 protein [Candidatus Moranbacteria bacterium]|nr:glycosyltransferase family 39 protein [Candidatus Moranbacteria bacterium]
MKLFQKMKGRKNIKVELFLASVIVMFFAFGFHNITRFVSSDEHFWLFNPESDRIHQYWQAIADQNWKKTRINDKPGITLAYTSGIGLFFEHNPEAQLKFTDGTVKIFDPGKIEEISFIYRTPILIVAGLFAIFFFWMLKKILGNPWVALWSIILMYLSPVIIGMSQIVNPDSVFWIFGFASILTYLAYLKFFEKKYCWLTLLFFGLSMASKYVSIIFIPFYFMMLHTYYYFEYDEWKDKTDEFSKRLLSLSLGYLAIVMGGFLIFALMMPAVFVKWKYFYEGTIGFPGMGPVFWPLMAFNLLIMADAYFLKSRFWLWVLAKLQPLKKWLPKLVYLILAFTFVFILINWLSRHRLLDLESIPFDTKRDPSFAKLPFLYKFLMESVPLVFSLTPFTLLLLLYVWIKSIFRKSNYEYLTFLFSSFIIIFYIAVIEQGLLLTIRYSIILYPLCMILISIAIWEFFYDRAKDGLFRKIFGTFSIVISAIAFLWALSAIMQAGIVSESGFGIFMASHKAVFSLILAASMGAIAFVMYRVLSLEGLKKTKPEMISFIIIAFSFISVWLIMPYYFSYSNDILPKKYVTVGSWGYGGYEAAQYMNKLPGAENLTVWADSYGFCEFFVGKCIHKAKVNTSKYHIDYFYKTAKSSVAPAFKYKLSENPVWEITLDGRYKNYIRLYKSESVAE